MKARLKKIEEIVDFLYIREIVGETIFDNLSNYPELAAECAELKQLALEYELLILSKQPAEHLKQPILNKVLSINNISLGIEKYRVSYIFFNENLEITDLL